MDANSRNDVISFYHAIYMASEGYQNRIGWTGSYGGNAEAPGAEGTISAAFAEDVERRVNYFRAMCGLSADVQVNSGATVRIVDSDPHKPLPTTTKAAAAQRSAYMIAQTYPSTGGLNHNPTDAACVAWTPAAWNANKNGNLALGFFGPGAIDSYMIEDANNLAAGHRRWIMYQRATDFATGDTPGQSGSKPPTNCLYVVPKNEELNSAVPPAFASYPSSGFFPADLNTPYWSLSYPGADFSTATVTMTNAASGPVTATVKSRANGYGDNTIIWEVPALAAAKSVSADLRWNVTVSGIKGSAVPDSHSYWVTLINPDLLIDLPSVTGPSSVLANGARFGVENTAGAELVEVDFFLKSNSAWTEGAELSPAPRITSKITAGYTFFSTRSGFVKTGSRAFNLTFPVLSEPSGGGLAEQSFEVDREILPTSGSPTLSFAYRRGLMTSGSRLAVEYSTDVGATWSLLHTIPGKGSADTKYQNASVTLPPGGPLRIRFRYYALPGSAVYTQQMYPTQATGIFIDDIATANCHWLDLKGSVSGEDMSSFVFDQAAAGVPLAAGQEWWLRPRLVLGGKAFPYGPAKVVTATGQADTFANWIAAEYPGHSLSFNADSDGDGLDDGIEYAFSLDPTMASAAPEAVSFPQGKIEISRELPIQRSGVVYSAQWSEDLVNWSSQGVTIRFEGGRVIASVARGETGRFLRWNITPQ